MGQTKKLRCAYVTPRDTADINQLISVLQGSRKIYDSINFKIGVRALIWFNVNSYCPQIDYYSLWGEVEEVCSVNEVARQLQLAMT
jgi:hypothetical protein